MKSVRKGLRKGDLVKDNFERLTCTHCDKNLKSQNDPDELHTVKTCPECGRRWKQL